MAGWIKIHRSIKKWEWFTDPNTSHLFLYLLLKASHKDSQWRGINIKSGQLIAGRKEISVNTGLSEQQVRTSLTKLKSTNEITIRSTNKFSLISITNWGEYQCSIDNFNQQNNQQLNQQSHHKQEVNNIRKDIYIDNELHNKDTLFEKFWNDFPSGKPKGNRAKAKEKFNMVFKEILNGEVGYENIRRGLEGYIYFCKAGNYNQHAVTWLNQRGWETNWIEQVPKNRNRARSSGYTTEDALNNTLDWIEQNSQ